MVRREVQEARAIWCTARCGLHTVVLWQLVFDMWGQPRLVPLRSTARYYYEYRQQGSRSNSSGPGAGSSSGEQIRGSDLAVVKRRVLETSETLGEGWGV